MEENVAVVRRKSPLTKQFEELAIKAGISKKESEVEEG